MNLCKNEKLDILTWLLLIEDSLFKSKLLLRDEFYSVSTDDQERYLKMAMRLDPNDPAILLRASYWWSEFTLHTDILVNMGKINALDRKFSPWRPAFAR